MAFLLVVRFRHYLTHIRFITMNGNTKKKEQWMNISKNDETGLFYMANIDVGLSRQEKSRERKNRRRNKTTNEITTSQIHRIKRRRRESNRTEQKKLRRNWYRRYATKRNTYINRTIVLGRMRNLDNDDEGRLSYRLVLIRRRLSMEQMRR